NSKADQAELVGTYISRGLYDLAENKLAEYVAENEEEEQWVELTTAIIENAKDSLLAIEVDSTEEAALYDQALSGGTSQATATARSILFIKNEDIFAPVFPQNQSTMSFNIPVAILPESELENDKENTLEHCNIFPNPFTDVISIEILVTEKIRYFMEVLDVTGRKTMTKNIFSANDADNKGVKRIEVDLSTLSNGLYQVTVYDSKGKKYSVKLLKTQK
ncbi:MAG: T9SS type A sorting domain-containing protein, partial [Bacteroidetes bacterium]|nr:T9SS type A sorting domain-containing protein [Bacteroidota bacterium]